MDPCLNSLHVKLLYTHCLHVNLLLLLFFLNLILSVTSNFSKKRERYYALGSRVYINNYYLLYTLAGIEDASGTVGRSITISLHLYANSRFISSTVTTKYPFQTKLVVYGRLNQLNTRNRDKLSLEKVQ